MSVWQFADLLPEVSAENRVSLGEGNTPLVKSRHIGPAAGLSNLYFKLESCNPTGSYKDRFAAVAISCMLDRHQRRCIATSSGNTGAALAAYCAAADISCEIAIVETAPQSKLLQMLAYGAKLRRVEGFGLDEEITSQVFARLVEQSSAPDAALQISAFRYSPLGMRGVETISYELSEQLKHAERPIDHVFVPAGGGGLALAVAQGVLKMQMPAAVHIAQPVGNDTIASALRNGKGRAVATNCTSAISGLQVPSVIDGDEALRQCRITGGTGHVVTDEEVWHCQSRLAQEEGILCEPAGAVSLAAALKEAKQNEFDNKNVIVCLITGTGFKDLASLEQLSRKQDCPQITIDELTF